MPASKSPRGAAAQPQDFAHGIVIAVHGRQLLVALDGEAGRTREAFSRGRRSEACVGDHVTATPLGDSQAVVESIATRRNLVRRSDGGRSKSLAANVDLALIVLSGEPPFSEELLMRVLAVAGTENIEVAIVAGKSDLKAGSDAIEPRLKLYESLGYRVMRLSAKHDPEKALALLEPVLAGRNSLLLGQSGMGKSTLVNLLVPEAGQATREISQALSSGRHTTSFCRMFRTGTRLSSGAAIIDSPGFQLFGVAHLSQSQLMRALPDFAPLLGQCRFANCLHRDEPGCAITSAATQGRIDARRHALYLRLLEETLT